MSAPVSVATVMRRAAELGTVEVRCPACKKTRQLSRDTVRRHPSPYSRRCQLCAVARENRRRTLDRRDGPHGAQAYRVVAPDYHQWWLSRYSLAEIRALAFGLDGPDIPQRKAEPAGDFRHLRRRLQPKESAT